MGEIVADNLLLFPIEHVAGERHKTRGFGAPCLRSVVWMKLHGRCLHRQIAAAVATVQRVTLRPSHGRVEYSLQRINLRRRFSDSAPMDIRKLVGGNVARLRKAKGMKQELFSEVAGVSQSYLSQIENGHVNLTLLGLNELAQALSVQPAELLRQDG